MSTKGVVNAGRNIRIREKENKIVREISDGLLSLRKIKRTSKYMGITNVFSKIANKYGVSIETIRRIYLRK